MRGGWRAGAELGGGGRELWLRRGLRGLLAGALLVLLLLGLRELARPFLISGVPATPAAANPAAGYPRQAAEAWACRFALAYLSYDSARPEARRQALQPYVAPGADLALGWDGRGQQRALAALPSGIRVRDEHRAQVTVAVLVEGGRWLQLAVPVLADGDRLLVTGAPALLPAPERAEWTPASDVSEEDAALAAQLRPHLSAFFRAYAQSSQAELSYYAAPGARFSGLGGQVRFGELSGLRLRQGPAERRSALASVRWLDPASGAGLTQSYRLRLEQVGGKWLVADLSPEE